MAAIGTLIAGKYEILKLTGTGGMSEVYLAMDKNLNKQWAVKQIKKKGNTKEDLIAIRSSIAEANMMKKLDHQCLPRIVDILDENDVIYVIMDYIEGEPLSRVLKKYGAQSQEVVVEWALSLCGVLDYLHTQYPPIIYRDMKPANIMLQPNGNIKLIDFGIAREYKELQSQDTEPLGTKGYAAPEQFAGNGQTDARTDIYCLGATMYHLVTGNNPIDTPYNIPPIRQINPELSSGLESIICKCTRLKPDERYQSCAELFYDLKHYEEADDSYRKHRKNKVVAVFTLFAFSILFLFIGAFGMYMKGEAVQTDYDGIVLMAEKSVTLEEQRNLYKEAINVKPEATDAYMGLIGTYKEDSVFSIEEEEQLVQELVTNLPVLYQQKEYGELAYEVGKLYWYYYDYGNEHGADNQITRMNSSIRWFEDAKKYGDLEAEYYARGIAYLEIGLFYKNASNIENEMPQESYSDFYQNLQYVFELANNEKNELLQLEIYRLCVSALENYKHKFNSQGIKKSELISFCQLVEEAAESITVTSDNTIELQKIILSEASETEENLNKADLQ